MKALMIGAALLAAGPALAQTPPSTPPAAAAADGMHMRGGGGLPSMHGLRGTWRDLSPEGRQIMRSALMNARDREARGRIQAARARMLDVLAQERLDVAALERAMADERSLAQAQHARAQSAMLDGLKRLSAADRRALAAGAREMRERMEARRERWRERREQIREERRRETI